MFTKRMVMYNDNFFDKMKNIFKSSIFFNVHEKDGHVQWQFFINSLVSGWRKSEDSSLQIKMPLCPINNNIGLTLLLLHQ